MFWPITKLKPSLKNKISLNENLEQRRRDSELSGLLSCQIELPGESI